MLNQQLDNFMIILCLLTFTIYVIMALTEFPVI